MGALEHLRSHLARRRSRRQRRRVSAWPRPPDREPRPSRTRDECDAVEDARAMSPIGRALGDTIAGATIPRRTPPPTLLPNAAAVRAGVRRERHGDASFLAELVEALVRARRSRARSGGHVRHAGRRASRPRATWPARGSGARRRAPRGARAPRGHSARDRERQQRAEHQHELHRDHLRGSVIAPHGILPAVSLNVRRAPRRVPHAASSRRGRVPRAARRETRVPARTGRPRACARPPPPRASASPPSPTR